MISRRRSKRVRLRPSACADAAARPSKEWPGKGSDQRTDRLIMGRYSLLGCVALLALTSALFSAPDALAQDKAGEQKAQPQKPVFLKALELINDTENERYIAKGNVEVHYEGRILRTDTLYYYPQDNRIHAIGSVVVVDTDGTVEFADEMELSDDLKSGVALAFFARLKNNATLGAVTATHSADGARNTLTKAYYTACKVCADEAKKSGHKPTWRIRARKVVEDQNTKMINYRDAVLEVKGIPVFYAPVFSHPDPESGRHSGLLYPNVRFSRKYGFSYEQPYYQVLGPYGDATLTPRIFSDINPLLSLEGRRNFHAGQFSAEGSITYAHNFDGKGKQFGDRNVRGHVFAQGKFDVSDKWLWGFGAAAVTDDLYLRRYDLPGENDTRGIFRADSQRLLNQVYVQGQGTRFFAQGGALRFQGLRAGDVDDRFPIVGPLFDLRSRLDDPLFGGAFMLRANTVALTRIDGTDSARASLSLDWSRRLVAKNGMILRPYAQGRTDLYQIHNTDFFADLGTNNRSVARALGVIGADFRWPFFRPGRHVNWTIEPLVQVAVSPNGSGAGQFVSSASGNIQPLIPNEDSIAVEFDGDSLFSTNRFTGYDRWEGGQRVNVGGRISGRWGKNGQISLLAGQVFRNRINPNFSAASGLRSKSSDYVSTFRFSPSPVLDLVTHTRFDKNNFNIRRIESDATINLERDQLGPVGRVLHGFSARAGYLNFDDVIASGRPTEEVRGNVTLGLTKHWSLSGGITRDLDAKKTRNSSIGLIYRDHCSSLEITYFNNNVSDRTLTSNTSIGIRFTLLTLGSFGSSR